MDGLTHGRIVHYITHTGAHLVAIVTHVWDKEEGIVNLTVFNPFDGQHGDEVCWSKTSIPYHPITAARVEEDTWHWIEAA